MNKLTKADKKPLSTVEFASSNALMQYDHFDVQKWQKYIEKEIGFVLPDIQLQWFINAIECVAKSNGLTAEQLWYKLPKDNELRQRLLDKVLIHESRFFRHKPSIDFVIKCASQYRTVDNNKALFRIWSVGCASGQEAWSLAMSLSAQQFSNYSILGTDVSEEAIKNARLGQYDKRQQCLIPQLCQQFIQPLLTKSETNNTNDSLSPTPEVNDSIQPNWQVEPKLRPHVSFSVHNIIEKTPPTAHPQHVIICQNMLLYFRKFDQRDILTRLAEQCTLGGYIILAPGEALFWRPSNMRRIAHPQVNVWQKISA